DPHIGEAAGEGLAARGRRHPVLAAEQQQHGTADLARRFGGADRMTPASRAKAFAGRFADVRVTVVPETGHSMTAEEPVAVLAAMRTVL
ncbi:MAG TPA: hypothetical protein VJO12_10145, partial [Stellaceae bacterium]|nr:hypothetical protein [Stellaceae bacterium]